MADDSEPTIDGVPLSKLVWVRATHGADLGSSGWERTASIRRTDDTLATLERWSRQDGHDTTKVAPNFRNSLHGALNNHVSSHNEGAWDDKPLVIVAPLAGMIAANGPPDSLNTVDTWWTLPDNGFLRLPGAILVAPDKDGAIAPGAVSRRAGDTLFYAAEFNDVREQTLLAGLSERSRAFILNDVVSKLSENGISDARLALTLPRAERLPEVNAALDKELTHVSKRFATSDAISEMGPVRRMAQWAWEMPSTAGVTHTNAMAISIGSSVQQHNGSAEDLAITHIEAGRPERVLEEANASSTTLQLAARLAESPAYQAWASAVTVDRELSDIVARQEPASQISLEGASRLVAMLDRAGGPAPLPAIVGRDRDNNRTNDRAIPSSPEFDRILIHAAGRHPEYKRLGNEALQAKARVAMRQEQAASATLASLLANPPADEAPSPPPIPQRMSFARKPAASVVIDEPRPPPLSVRSKQPVMAPGM